MALSLPSSAFLLLTDRRLGLDGEPVHFKDAVAAVKSGRWPLDATEVDPRTGWNLVQTAVRTSDSLMDDQWRGLLELAHELGADLNQVGPDGKTALEWAHARKKWDVAKTLEELGAVPGNLPSAAMQDVQQALTQWLPREPIMGTAHTVAKMLQACPSGTLDERVNGHIPLGLLPILNKLKVNGADLVTMVQTSDPSSLKELDSAFKAMRNLGQEASRQSPESKFPLWCWATLAQVQKWIPHGISQNRIDAYKSHWVSLEKTLLRRYRKHAAPEFELAQAFAEELKLTVGQAWAHRKDMAERKPESKSVLYQFVQKVSTYGVSALAQFGERLEREGNPFAEEVKSQAWKLLADLTDQLPLEFFQESSVGDGWRSGMYYAVRHHLGRTLSDQEQAPAFVDRPWLTVPALLTADEPQENVAQATRWLVANPQIEDYPKARALMDTIPSIRAGIEAVRLSVSLDDDLTPTTSRGPRL